MSQSTSVVDTGVDWITATSKASGINSPLALQGRLAVALERERGNLEKPWKWQGYDGLACGEASVGRRPDGTIVHLSSVLASERWRHLLRDCDNVSRLDLQVTVSDPDPHATRASVAYAQSTLAKVTNGRPWTTTLIVSDPAGQTCYLGSRTSDKCGRIYDKGAQSKRREDKHKWRYEVEYKRACSLGIVRSLEASVESMQEIAGLVAAFFRQRGVVVPFRGSSSIAEPSASRRPSDAERTLDWIRLQVQPAVQRLMDTGYADRTLAALGLLSLLESEGDRDSTPVYRRLGGT